MKKRLLSILLVLTMVLSLVPAMSVTASAETIDRTSWTKITGSTTIETKGDYYLDSDMTANITVAEGVEATLDLNGHILTAGSTGSAIVNNGTLTLTDNDKSVTHYYTAGSNGLWTLNTGASSGTPYENLTERPAADTVIAIKGGAVTGGTKGTLIDGSNYGCGYTVAVGGGIYSAGDLTVDGAVICGNTIDNSQGGTCMGIGIFCAGENCTLKNAIICGNCSIPQEYNPRGGAIFSASTIKAEDSSLSFNTVSFTGGAIMLRNKQDKTGYFSTLTMKNCSLLGNSAFSGGAVYLLGDEEDAEKTVFTFESCTLEYNFAENDGGAISIDSGKLNITGGSISHNTCIYNGIYLGSGGAIYDGADTTLKNVVISDNSAARGGAIWLNQKNLTAENVTFTKNKAAGSVEASDGGALYVRSDSKIGSIRLTNCEISENEADRNGGGINMVGKSTAEITGGKITGNVAGGTGGGLYIDASLGASGMPVAIGKATLTEVEVSGNKAVNGGGVGMNASAQLLMNGCTVTGNSATETDIENTGLGGGIYKPGTYQQDKAEWHEKVVLLNTQITGNTASINGGGVYFKPTKYETACFAEGTLITLADGTEKKIEEIAAGDKVKTFDHEHGCVSEAEVYYAFKGDTQTLPFTLRFEGGLSLSIAGLHDLLEQSSLKYVTITEDNADDYIGKYFYGEDGQWHKLLSVTAEETPCNFYSIYTAEHQNCFANGLLTVPDDVDYFLNIYGLDESLKADGQQLAADIEEYGLADYQYFYQETGMSREWYDDAGAKYLFIAIGKSLFTEEEARKLFDSTLEDREKNSDLLSAAEMPRLMLLANAPAPSLDDFDEGYLHVGTGTVVTDNTVGTKRNNVYLESSEKKLNSSDPWEPIDSLIRVCAGATDMNIGVTTSGTPTVNKPLRITVNGTANQRTYFFDDRCEYAVVHIADKTESYIALSCGYKVTEADCENGEVSVGYSKVYIENDTVTVIPKGDEGYTVDKVCYTPKDGNETEITPDNGFYTFTMPAKPVTVSSTFKTAHTHAWTYSLSKTAKDNDTITAACTVGCSYTGTEKSLTICAPSALTYDGTAKAASIKDGKTSLGGIATLPDIQYQKKIGENTYDTATTTAPTTAGTYKASITVNDGTTDFTAYVEYTIAPKQLTVSGTTVDGKTYDGSATATATAGVLDGVVSGDKGNVTVSIQSAEFADKNVGEDKTVTVKYSISGTAAANYLAPVDDSGFEADISPKQLAISTESGKSTTVSGKTYNGTTTASATIGTVIGIVSGDSVTVAVDTATFDTKDVGTGKSVAVAYKISGTDAGNYEKPVDDTKTASITAKSINVTADNKNSYVGSDLVTLTYTVDTTTPLVSGEALAGTLTTNADKDVVGSAYQITQGTLTNANNPNYSITFTAGTYTVKALETQTLSFPDGDQTKTYGDAAFAKAVSSACTSVTYESSNPTVATVNASTGEVTILKTGTTTITAKAAASATYASAEASYTLTVNNASQSAPNAGKADETIKGKADGKLTALTDAMEYRKATDSTYTAITGTEVTGLAAGDYKVRYAAKANYDASPDQTLTIAEGSTLTLTFDAKGGTAADQIPGLTWQATVTVPETTKTGYTFQEWNANEAGTGSKLTAATKIEASDTYYAIWQANSYTVTFHENNGTGTMEPQSFVYDAAQSLTANTFTRSGFNFTGWASTPGAKYAEYLDGASVKNLTAEVNGNVDLYAVWTEKPVYSVSGRVQQEKVPSPENVPNALLELKQGQNVIASTHTDSNGDYAFTGIESGEYNIVVTGHASGTQDKTKTMLILLEGENKTGVNVRLPQGDISSVVEVKDNTPQILAGGLDEEAAKQAGSNLSDTIRLVLTVESVEDVTSTPGAPAAEIAAQTAIKQEAAGKTVDFIDMDVTKFVNAADSTVHETDTVLEIIVPYQTDGRTDITVYRFHDADGDGNLDAGQQIAMTKLNARPTAPFTDNTYFVGDGFIAIYTKFFSAYAIGYSIISSETGTDAKTGKCPQDETCVYAKFTDSDPKAWYHPGVHFCVEKGYMVGISDKLFAPSGTLSRGMIVAMLWRMEGSPVANYAMSFKDVTDGLWYTEAIRWAQSTGVVKGYDTDSFGPNDNVTREQLAAILMRYAAFKGIDVSKRAGLKQFADVKSISDWALENVKWANAVGMILGRTETTIVPTGNATRAEAANMLQRFFETVLK